MPVARRRRDATRSPPPPELSLMALNAFAIARHVHRDLQQGPGNASSGNACAFATSDINVLP